MHPQKFGCTPKNEGKRVHVPPDEKTCGHAAVCFFVLLLFLPMYCLFLSIFEFLIMKVLFICFIHVLYQTNNRDFLSFVYVIQLFVFLIFNIFWSEANKLYIIFTNLESFFHFFPLCRTVSVEIIHAQHQSN